MSNRISSQKIRKRLHVSGLCARRSMMFIPLTARHYEIQRKWAAEHQKQIQSDWNQVLFTEESQFSLQCNTRRVLVCKEKGFSNNPIFVQ
ncbi:hypothetical protein TNCV_3239411 [Trichonephila clavipes]|nr:hypothetical protein TNCV_3239411 [Trichonephila clavipes]